MRYDELMSMDMGGLVDASHDKRRTAQERLQATEAIMARIPEWDGGLLDLSSGQQARLRAIVFWANGGPVVRMVA